MIHTNRFIAFFCVAASVFATSCVNEFEEGQAPVSGEGYYISLTGDVNKGGTESRAHWDINNEGNQTLAFAWDTSENEMKSFVWRSNAFVDFEGGQKYSPTTVTPTDTKNQAQLQITTSLSQAYAQNDVIWAVSPLAETNNISADNKVTFTLPNVYTQTALNSTEHLKQYILMSGTGTVSAENTASISFDVLPAIYRFKVTNNDESETLTVNEVSLTGPFCNKAVLEYGKTPVYSVADGSYTIKVATPAQGLEVAAGATAYLYALVFPTETSKITDNITLSFNGKYGDTPVEGYTKTAKCSEIYTYDLDSNTYYDMEVPVDKKAAGENVQVTTVWEGTPVTLTWGGGDGGVNLQAEWFDNGVKENDVITLYFQTLGPTGENYVKIYDPNWTSLTEINGIGENAAKDVTGLTEFSFKVKSNYLSWFNKASGDALVITGLNVKLNKVTWTHQ